MFKNNKFKVIFSSIVILLPILFGLIMWEKLPNSMATHWGADNVADGFSGKAFAVFGLPIILLILHLICLFITSLDRQQKKQNQKALSIVFWIIPFLSLVICAITYSVALAKEVSLEIFMPLLFAIMFIYVGNYMPKTSQNRTLGIKIPWTLGNEENWNKTHRFSGKLWVIGGFIMLLTTVLHTKTMLLVAGVEIIVMVVVPVLYSYSIYKNHQKQGVIYNTEPKSKAEKIAIKISAVLAPIILIGLAILMFTGDINIVNEDDVLKINASYFSDLQIKKTEIEKIEYRENFDKGIRISGFGSARLSMGTFENSEFGIYTIYSYTKAEDCIVLKSEEKTLVISGKNDKETQKIYKTLTASN